MCRHLDRRSRRPSPRESEEAKVQRHPRRAIGERNLFDGSDARSAKGKPVEMAAIGERKSCRTEPARQRRKARRDKRGAIDERRPPRDTHLKTRRRRRLTGQATPPCSPLECPAALAAKKTVCRSPPVAAISSRLAIASLREPPRSPPALAAPFRPSSNREKSRFPRTRATRETACAVSIVAAIAPRRSRRARRRALPSARSRRALPRILLRIRGKGGKA
jgi:hypothetical protein